MSEKLEVYKAIAAITGELAKDGIGKNRKNQMQGFQYRGIDDVYAALSPLLSANNLCILPRITSKEVIERVNAKGTALFYTTVAAEFDMVSALDGSCHTVSSYGEAMDSGDKSIGKAMSYAYKAMAFMAFAIPTEGDNDPDANSHELKPSPKKEQPKKEENKPASETTEVADVQTKLGLELSEYCQHDAGRMASVLRQVTYYKKNAGETNESEGWMKMEDLAKPSTNERFLKWCGAALSKLRKHAVESVNN